MYLIDFRPRAELGGIGLLPFMGKVHRSLGGLRNLNKKELLRSSSGQSSSLCMVVLCFCSSCGGTHGGTCHLHGANDYLFRSYQFETFEAEIAYLDALAQLK